MGVVIRRDFGGLAQIKEVGADKRLFPCRHLATVVDAVEHTVACASCEAPLDPFQVLLEYARKERHWRGWDAELNRTQQRIDELKAEERKVKARTKNAARKEAATAVADERARSERARFEIAEKARDIAQLCKSIERLARMPQSTLAEAQSLNFERTP
jgi:hypothetical protein